MFGSPRAKFTLLKLTRKDPNLNGYQRYNNFFCRILQEGATSGTWIVDAQDT